jgi:hypothetical protein
MSRLEKNRNLLFVEDRTIQNLLICIVYKSIKIVLREAEVGREAHP